MKNTTLIIEGDWSNSRVTQDLWRKNWSTFATGFNRFSYLKKDFYFNSRYPYQLLFWFYNGLSVDLSAKNYNFFEKRYFNFTATVQ